MRAVLVAAVAALCALAQPVHAQAPAYPSKPVRLVVPFPPGGGFDGIGRPFSEKLGAILGQPVVMDYRPGAGGNIGVEHAAHSAPDGYTLLLANVSMTTNPAMWKKIGYDAVNDFAPVSRIGGVSSAFAIHPSVPARDLRELMAYSKAKPLNFASPGVGTSSHLIGEMMNIEGILSLVHIPYKGTAPAVADAIGGQLDAVMVPLVSLAPHIKSGKLRGIAVSGANRAAMLPDLPTFAESGFPQIQSDTWYALFVPAGTPEAIVRRLNEASVQVIAQPDVIDRLRKTGYEPGSSTPEALGALVKSEVGRWAKLAAAAKIPKQ
ncbi:MAG: tripartite tricarboxylate transporter substrate binding protein [Proteobacteria bacterium]|nr:tripartite tricarboxylate transporter substrate binding protein [Pseudomonadota bacterium]